MKTDHAVICTECGHEPPRPSLKHCVILVTERCNARCRICGYGNGPTEPTEELSRDQLVELIADAHGLGCRSIILSGGEPLLRSDIYEVFAAVCGLGIEASCAVCTNGSMIDASSARRLAAAKPSGQIVISVDGHEAALHDTIRGVPGSFDQAIAALDHLNEAFGDTEHVGINTIVNRLNLAHLDEITQMVATHGARVHKLAPVYGPSADPELRLEPSQLQALYDDSPRLTALAQSLGLVSVNLSPYALVATGGCLVPSFLTFVDSGGRIHGCNVAKGGFNRSQRKPLGQFQQRGDLERIWCSSSYDEFRRGALTKAHPFCARACEDVTAHTMNFLHAACGECLRRITEAA